MDEELEPDEIRLTVPADPAFARVARVAAGGVAARLGFSYDEVQEVRLAVAEAWSVALGSASRDGAARLVLRAMAPGLLAVELAVPSPAAGAEPPPDPRRDDEEADRPGAADPAETSRRVLAAIAEEVHISPDRTEIRFRVRSDG